MSTEDNDMTLAIPDQTQLQWTIPRTSPLGSQSKVHQPHQIHSNLQIMISSPAQQE